ncbi:Snake venom serine protease 3 [Bagarius yarrelli]|uniref:Snake venom serine protease 3 n=1 Tax=Bagarius yarrelli TaxID=175774 RepID=A0A556TS07_BAGYA|nr:Snake venom serine protease 3 [Bagarius yarrelli]
MALFPLFLLAAVLFHVGNCGAHDLNKVKILTHLEVKLYHIHPMFDAENFLNDIMLLQLKTPLKWAKNINCITVPKKTKEEVKPKQVCSIAGWGKQSKNGKSSDRLMEVNVTVLDAKVCKMAWSEPFPVSSLVCTSGHGGFLELSEKVKKGVEVLEFSSKHKPVQYNSKCQVAGWGKTETQNMTNDLLVTNVSTVNFTLCKKEWNKVNIKLPPNVLCAGGYKTRSGACQGDSGGPLVCGGLAVGIVSFNYKGDCNYPNVPNVYTEISVYSDWIKRVIKEDP